MIDEKALRDLAFNTPGATLCHFSPKQSGGKLFLAIESDDPAPIVEAATMKGIRGASIEDTGLATYVFWRHLPCHNSSDKQLAFTLRHSDLSGDSSSSSG